MSSAPTPSAADQAAVQTQLNNMKAFNDNLYNYGQGFVSEAVGYLSGSNGDDPGSVIGINIVEGAFWAIGSNFGSAGNFAASFFSGMLASWVSNPPPDLSQSWLALSRRVHHTFLALDDQIGTYYSNVVEYWDTQFTFNGNTCKLGDLAQQTFPVNGTVYDDMFNAALFALKQSIWLYLLQNNFQCTLWQTSPSTVVNEGDAQTLPTTYMQGYYSQNPASFIKNVSWSNGSKCVARGWTIEVYTLGTQPSEYHENTISDTATQIVFQDSTPGTPLNKGALFAREDIFTNDKIPQGTFAPVYATGAAAVAPGSADEVSDADAPQPLSTAYLRAMAQGKTLPVLIASQGRAAVEARVLDKARSDPYFRLKLKLAPLPTLEAFLGVLIPETIDLRIIAEGPRSFGLVLPDFEAEAGNQ